MLPHIVFSSYAHRYSPNQPAAIWHALVIVPTDGFSSPREVWVPDRTGYPTGTAGNCLWYLHCYCVARARSGRADLHFTALGGKQVFGGHLLSPFRHKRRPNSVLGHCTTVGPQYFKWMARLVISSRRPNSFAERGLVGRARVFTRHSTNDESLLLWLQFCAGKVTRVISEQFSAQQKAIAYRLRRRAQ